MRTAPSTGGAVSFCPALGFEAQRRFNGKILSRGGLIRMRSFVSFCAVVMAVSSIATQSLAEDHPILMLDGSDPAMGITQPADDAEPRPALTFESKLGRGASGREDTAFADGLKNANQG